MLKLYRLSGSKKEYWETWDDTSFSHTVHWGELGTEGQSKSLQSTPSSPASTVIQKEIDALVASGFTEMGPDEYAILLIEYAVDGFGSPSDLGKRHRLQARMDETLGWTGLGACDGGSIGSGTMEVCCFVVDFELAKRVIANDLREQSSKTSHASTTKVPSERGRLQT